MSSSVLISPPVLLRRWREREQTGEHLSASQGQSTHDRWLCHLCQRVSFTALHSTYTKYLFGSQKLWWQYILSFVLEFVYLFAFWNLFWSE